MGVELGAILERLPGRPTVAAAHQPPFLHRAEDDTRITGAERQALHMRDVRSRRECPVDRLRHRPELLGVDPALPAVQAFEHRGRASANVQLACMGMLGKGPDLLIDDALVDLPPDLSGVIAAEHSAFARAGVQAVWVVTVHDHRPAHGRVAVEGERLRFVASAARTGLKQPLVRADVQPPVRCYDHGVAPFRERRRRFVELIASANQCCRIARFGLPHHHAFDG